MKQINYCPICGASSFKNVLKAPYFRGERKEFQIQECVECKLWITNPRPEDQDLTKYYEGDYVSHTEDKKGLINKIYLQVRKLAVKSKLKLINSLVTEKGILLDFGAGTGFYLKAAEENGWEVMGVEPSPQARQLAAAKGLKLFSPEEFSWKKKQCNVITLWHVLEHLPDLQEHMANFTNSLKAGGYLVIAVPNHESLDAQYYGEAWAALDVPLHLYHFKKQNIRDLAEQHNFKVQDIKNMPYDSFYVSMLSEKIKNDKGNIAKAFFKGLQSNLKGSKTKNASSLIYILKKG